MNILLKIPAFLLFVIIFGTPLMAQKKLALANECYNAKAYYLASRYYEEVFANFDDCHPDQIKMARSLAATQRLVAAEQMFHKYIYCQKNSPTANMVVGKAWMDLEFYENAIPYFEKGMKVEPQAARHYIIACRTALHKSEEPIVFGKENTSVATDVIPQITINVNQNVEPQTSRVAPADNMSTTDKTDKINLYDAMVSGKPSVEKYEKAEPATRMVASVPEASEVIKAKPTDVNIKKESSPYGVRLGTYKNTSVPDLSIVEEYGRIEQKQWNGKTVVFLLGFSDKDAAVAAVERARKGNFRTATLVKKQASGRMKSIK